ncbi:four helix bundle protein [Candidatus Aerophobetes bacterium]|nr:four helix bundle protein [Candidatus Aerophobetes bacterium]
MENWKRLKVWEKAHSLVIKIYRVTKDFPQDERYRLIDQICRSVISIPTNIVEGQSRNTTKEYLQFLYNARGSLEETRYHLLLAKDLRYLTLDRYEGIEEKCKEVSLMLNSLIKSLKKKTGLEREQDLL